MQGVAALTATISKMAVLCLQATGHHTGAPFKTLGPDLQEVSHACSWHTLDQIHHALCLYPMTMLLQTWHKPIWSAVGLAWELMPG